MDFIRIACAVPEVRPGDVKKNAQDIREYMKKANGQKVDVLLFPELALTGYTCGELFTQDLLWEAVKTQLRQIALDSSAYPEMVSVVGLPVRLGGKLYNCAAVIARGEVVGLVPKTHLNPAEKRWFASGGRLPTVHLEPDAVGMIASQDYWTVPMGAKQLFRVGEDVLVGIEICEDLMVPQPCSSALAVGGAEVILNLSASHALAGKAAFRRDLVKNQSAACNCVYAYTSAGYTESTSDLVYSGHSLIGENGRILAENARAIDTGYLLVQDCDLGRIRADRRGNQNYGIPQEKDLLQVQICSNGLRSDGSLYPVRKKPFVPENKTERKERCREIFDIQVTGLKQRLKILGANAVVGVSGGLDSTLALLVAVEAMRQLGRPAVDVHGITMPCFGTSDRTFQNARKLMAALGITVRKIDIREAVGVHFRDIGQDEAVQDAVYENAQARERTQVLMDYAASVGGIVVGTGDLSELALGWCTYNGDHMSMYGVNADVPKTLIPAMLETLGGKGAFTELKDVLRDIVDTPISPELLPAAERGQIGQKTEDVVGPYALHDFFLYYTLRFGFAPAKTYHLACRAFGEDYESDTIKKWLKTFYRRFFCQQFKRSCMPEGVKVGSVGLSPRGDWHMPGDISSELWLEEADRL